MIKTINVFVVSIFLLCNPPYVFADSNEQKTPTEFLNNNSLVDSALRYRTGLGVEQNHTKANQLLQTAAERGSTDAKFFLAGTYYRGLGVEKDYEKSRLLLEDIASEDHSEAIFYLGYFYYHGLGVDRDPEKSKQYFERAANQGHIQSKFFLGVIYRDQLNENHKNSQYWFEVSCSDGLLNACNALQNLNDYNNLDFKLETFDILQ